MTINNQQSTINNGFTLIELLVVISIIGLLAGIALVSFTGSQRQARDTQRKADLKQYQTSLENYANKNNGLYPARSATVPADTTLCTDLGLTGCPPDPKSSQDPSFTYNFQSNSSAAPGTPAATAYVLWAKLENTTDYWVVCSSGKVGAKTQVGFGVSGGNCPL